jgi:uncharacterized protein (DUF305 family)
MTRAAVLSFLALVACAPKHKVLGVSNGVTPASIAKADGGHVPITQADINFMSGMIGHHAQAVVMAGWAESHGANRAIQAMSARIVVAQRDEIGLMQSWLRDRKLPVPDADPAGWRMTMNGQQHTMAMPGMLTPEQMKELDAARGGEFDRLFLKYMIQHHEGAIAMVATLIGSHGAAQDELVFKFASDVNVDQITEVDFMKKMLADLPASRSSP